MLRVEVSGYCLGIKGRGSRAKQTVRRGAEATETEQRIASKLHILTTAFLTYFFQGWIFSVLL